METGTQLLSGDIVDTVAEATPEKRTGRKSMSRRSGQNGCIQEDGNWYVVRFWKDVAGQGSNRGQRSGYRGAFRKGCSITSWHHVPRAGQGVARPGKEPQAQACGSVNSRNLGKLLGELAQSQHR